MCERVHLADLILEGSQGKNYVNDNYAEIKVLNGNEDDTIDVGFVEICALRDSDMKDQIVSVCALGAAYLAGMPQTYSILSSLDTETRRALQTIIKINDWYPMMTPEFARQTDREVFESIAAQVRKQFPDFMIKIED